MDKEELNQIVNAIKEGLTTAMKEEINTTSQETLNRSFTSDLAALNSSQEGLSKQIQSTKEVLTIQINNVDQKVTDISKKLNRRIADKISIGIPIAAALILALTSILIHFV